MADPDRARSKRKITRPTRPYLSEWILTLPSPRKEVLLQVFSGTPEVECARKLDMPVSEVEEIAKSAAKECPAVMEDEYTMAYYSAKTIEEFRRVTGQGAGIYKFLSLRYHKSKPKPVAVASLGTSSVGSSATNGLASSSSVSTQPITHSQKAKSPRKRAKRSASKPEQASSVEPKSSEQAKQEGPTAEEIARAHANDPEAQRRREARRAARELERARRLSGDW